MYNKMTIKTCLSQIIETDKASIKDCNVSLIFVQLSIVHYCMYKKFLYLECK